jgi:hypothetical protein
LIKPDEGPLKGSRLALTVQDALNRLYKEGTSSNISPRKMTDVLFSKLNAFPEAIGANLHRAKCIVPRDVARILAQNPQVVAGAVEAFYTRDSLSMKVR